jgi:actin-like ATPase involved in cell morphogenesis
MQLWKLYLKLTKLAADIYNWIYLAGGGSMLRVGQRSLKKTDLPVYIAEDPLRAVVHLEQEWLLKYCEI